MAHTATDPRRPTKFAAKTSQNLLAAAISVSVSAILFAYAIIPASPTLMA
ncbi:enoyl-CoA hydratase [Erythrobacter sp.]|nr:enoyl-CoA hydratase [Erythrobacter sp.]